MSRLFRRLRMSVQVSTLTLREILRAHVRTPAALTSADFPTGLCIAQRPHQQTTTTNTFLVLQSIAAHALNSVTSTKARAFC